MHTSCVPYYLSTQVVKKTVWNLDRCLRCHLSCTLTCHVRASLLLNERVELKTPVGARYFIRLMLIELPPMLGRPDVCTYVLTMRARDHSRLRAVLLRRLMIVSYSFHVGNLRQEIMVFKCFHRGNGERIVRDSWYGDGSGVKTITTFILTLNYLSTNINLFTMNWNCLYDVQGILDILDSKSQKYSGFHDKMYVDEAKVLSSELLSNKGFWYSIMVAWPIQIR